MLGGVLGSLHGLYFAGKLRGPFIWPLTFLGWLLGYFYIFLIWVYKGPYIG